MSVELYETEELESALDALNSSNQTAEWEFHLGALKENVSY